MTTTGKHFTAFLEKINPTDAQRPRLRKADSTEKYCVQLSLKQSTLPVQRVILIGSAARGTIIRPINDIDVMAELQTRTTYSSSTAAILESFLQRVRTALNANTSIKKIGARGQAVASSYKRRSRGYRSGFSMERGRVYLPRGDGGGCSRILKLRKVVFGPQEYDWSGPYVRSQTRSAFGTPSTVAGSSHFISKSWLRRCLSLWDPTTEAR